MSQASLRRSRFALGRGPGLVAFVLVVGLLLVMAIEPTRQLLTQEDRVSSMAEDLAKIERLNAQLEARIDRLKDPDYIEQQARAQAGLVHPGEVPYVVMPPSDGTHSNDDRRRRRTEPAPAPEPGVVESFLDFIGFL
ncbi:MAG: FtsB family cell division protein [Actinomycetota bacterium]